MPAWATMRSSTALPTLACAIAMALPGCGGGDAPAPKPQPDPATGVVIWAVGDGGLPNEASEQVAELIERDDPDHVIYLGDVYGSGTVEEFLRFREVFGPLVERMWPTPGNHEWANHATGYAPFWRTVLGEDLPLRYERRAGGWEVLSANSETSDDEQQLRWLRDEVRAAGTCRIAVWHRPRRNAGEHRDEEQDVARMWEAVKGRVSIVLSGHDHNLQRFRPVEGTVQYISGAGGRGHHEVDESDPRLAFSDDSAYGALRIILRPGRADLRFYSTDGTELDRSTVGCEG